MLGVLAQPAGRKQAERWRPDVAGGTKKIRLVSRRGLLHATRLRLVLRRGLLNANRLRLVSRIVAGGLPDDSWLSIGVCRSVLLDGSRLSIAVAA